MPRKVVSRSTFVDPSKVGKRVAGTVNRIYQGTVLAKWTCSSCGNAGIPGNRKTCPNCGNPKDKGEQYQSPGSAAPLLSDAQLADTGATRDHSQMDRLCPHCGSKNKPNAETCSQCGSSLKPDAEEEESVLKTTSELNSVAPEAPINLWLAPKFWAGVSGLLMVAIVILAWIFWPREYVVTVQSVSWSRQIKLEQLQYNEHGGWSVPEGADQLASETRFSHNKDVLDHYENVCHTESQFSHFDYVPTTRRDCHDESGYSHTEETCYDDGTCDREDVYTSVQVCTDVPDTDQVARYKDVQVCEDVPRYRQEPVFATYYTYKVWEWVPITAATAQGTTLQVNWPQVQLTETVREGGRVESYSITFIDVKENKYTLAPQNAEEFQKYQLDSQWKVKISGGTIMEVIGPN